MKAEQLSHRKFNETSLDTKELLQIARQAAHDIRAPLSALNVLSQTLEHLPEESRELAQAAIRRISDIANDLLLKSKMNPPESRKSHAHEEVAPLIQEIVSEKQLLLSRRGRIHIDFNITEACRGVCEINRSDLQRVISNLLNNAIEAFDAESGQIAVNVESMKDQIEIKISDNGKGIPNEILQSLGQKEISYGKFGQSHSGNGLGVLHAKNFVESFGGTMEISSQVGHGTTIKLSLPRS